MSEEKSSIITSIKSILSQKILQQEGSGSSLTDSELSSIDSIGRLSLTVELENEFDCSLSGEEMTPEILGSFDALADYIIKEKNNPDSM
jgi:acyl carrier protein